MKKKLNIEGITNELAGGSAFFPGYNKPDSPPPPQPNEGDDSVNLLPTQKSQEATSESPKLNHPKTKGQVDNVTMIPRHHDTATPSNRDTMQPEDFTGSERPVRIVRVL